MKKLIVLTICILVASTLFIYQSIAEEKKVVKGKDAPTGDIQKVGVKEHKAVKDMTAVEIIAEIKDELDSDDEILNLMPNIKSRKDANGKGSYVYVEGAKECALEALDKPRLEKLLARIHQTATQIRTGRINKQLETIQQVQNIQRSAVQSQLKSPPAPPRPPAQSQQYRVPQVPPAPPKR